jgi:hypothetical protein
MIIENLSMKIISVRVKKNGSELWCPEVGNSVWSYANRYRDSTSEIIFMTLGMHVGH